MEERETGRMELPSTKMWKSMCEVGFLFWGFGLFAAAVWRGVGKGGMGTRGIRSSVWIY